MLLEKGIVYDIGAHKGMDADYYLKSGYTVVVVEANPRLCKLLREKFSIAIREKKMIVVEAAIDRFSDESVPFFVSEDQGESSRSPERLKKMRKDYETITVKTKTLSELFSEYGKGLYCKMDIEGFDIIALKTLEQTDDLPVYFSIELCGLPIESLVQQPKHAGRSRSSSVDALLDALCPCNPTVISHAITPSPATQP